MSLTASDEASYITGVELNVDGGLGHLSTTDSHAERVTPAPLFFLKPEYVRVTNDG